MKKKNENNYLFLNEENCEIIEITKSYKDYKSYFTKIPNIMRIIKYKLMDHLNCFHQLLYFYWDNRNTSSKAINLIRIECLKLKCNHFILYLKSDKIREKSFEFGRKEFLLKFNVFTTKCV
jgi:hypothetical protein